MVGLSWGRSPEKIKGIRRVLFHDKKYLPEPDEDRGMKGEGLICSWRSRDEKPASL